MPNGGPRPDCVHCQHYRGRPISDKGEPFCARHNMLLVSPIYAFCSQYTDPEPDGGIDWLDAEIESRGSLRDDMMYVWIGGYKIKFIYVPLAPISEYAYWTAEMYYDERGALIDKYRDQLNSE